MDVHHRPYPSNECVLDAGVFNSFIDGRREYFLRQTFVPRLPLCFEQTDNAYYALCKDLYYDLVVAARAEAHDRVSIHLAYTGTTPQIGAMVEPR